MSQKTILKKVLILELPEVTYDPKGKASVCKLCNPQKRIENCKNHILQKHLTNLLQGFMKDEILDGFKTCFKEFYQDLNPFASHFVKNQNGEIYFKTNGQFCFKLRSEASKLVYRSIPKYVLEALLEQTEFETITNKEMFKLHSRYITGLLSAYVDGLQPDISPDDFETKRNELEKYIALEDDLNIIKDKLTKKKVRLSHLGSYDDLSYYQIGLHICKLLNMCLREFWREYKWRETENDWDQHRLKSFIEQIAIVKDCIKHDGKHQEQNTNPSGCCNTYLKRILKENENMTNIIKSALENCDIKTSTKTTTPQINSRKRQVTSKEDETVAKKPATKDAFIQIDFDPTNFGFDSDQTKIKIEPKVEVKEEIS